jgi:hypothetical protein
MGCTLAIGTHIIEYFELLSNQANAPVGYALDPL